MVFSWSALLFLLNVKRKTAPPGIPARAVFLFTFPSVVLFSPGKLCSGVVDGATVAA
jgi:hypothetical protein